MNKQEIYDEMKNNQINRENLINMLRNSDNPFADAEQRKAYC
jgi:hypothetical protein